MENEIPVAAGYAEAYSAFMNSGGGMVSRGNRRDPSYKFQKGPLKGKTVGEAENEFNRRWHDPANAQWRQEYERRATTGKTVQTPSAPAASAPVAASTSQPAPTAPAARIKPPGTTGSPLQGPPAPAPAPRQNPEGTPNRASLLAGANGSPRINRLTGLPFGFNPATDTLPEGSSPAVQSAFAESQKRMQDAGNSTMQEVVVTGRREGGPITFEDDAEARQRRNTPGSTTDTADFALNNAFRDQQAKAQDEVNRAAERTGRMQSGRLFDAKGAQIPNPVAPVPHRESVGAEIVTAGAPKAIPVNTTPPPTPSPAPSAAPAVPAMAARIKPRATPAPIPAPAPAPTVDSIFKSLADSAEATRSNGLQQKAVDRQWDDLRSSLRKPKGPGVAASLKLASPFLGR